MSSRGKDQPTPHLRKSDLINGNRCERLLVYSRQYPELLEPPGPERSAAIAADREVQGEFRRRHAEGVLVASSDFDAAAAETQTLLRDRRLPLFDAAFSYQGMRIRVDMLSTNTHGGLTMTEVKAAGKLEHYHVLDAAVQAWVVRGAGVNLTRIELLTLDRRCRFENLDRLFKTHVITDQVDKVIFKVPQWIAQFQKLAAQKALPQVEIGNHCLQPYPCPVKGACWGERQIPAPSVLEIPRLRSAIRWQLFHDGFITPKAVQQRLDEGAYSEDFSPWQRRILQTMVQGERFVDARGIQRDLAGWQWPLAFLDFETMAPAVPRFHGCVPFENVPVQFSCHVQKTPGGAIEHHEFLNDDAGDPQQAVAAALVAALPPSGSIVAYFSDFEGQCLKRLAQHVPTHRNALKGAAKRLVDLLPVIRDHVYDLKFAGSFSLKKVAPAILGAEGQYRDFEVGDGASAQIAYLHLLQTEPNSDERQQLRQALLAYCAQDTLVLVKLHRWLQNLRS